MTVLRFATNRLAYWSRREPSQSLRRSLLVVLTPPAVDADLGMGQTRAPVLIETLVTEPAVVRFDVEVLVRLARLDQAHRAAGYMRPGSDNDDFAKSVWGTQYLSIRDTERLNRAGIEPSVGSRDDAYDQRPRRDGDRGVSPARFMNAPGQTVKVRRHSIRSILATIRRYPCGFMNNAGGRLR